MVQLTHVYHYRHFQHEENEAERRTRSLTVVPQPIRGRSRTHKQPVILTITLLWLSKRNIERVLPGREKLAEGYLRKDIQHPKPTVHVEWVSQYEEVPTRRMGSRHRTVSGPWEQSCLQEVCLDACCFTVEHREQEGGDRTYKLLRCGFHLIFNIIVTWIFLL